MAARESGMGEGEGEGAPPPAAPSRAASMVHNRREAMPPPLRGEDGWRQSRDAGWGVWVARDAPRGGRKAAGVAIATMLGAGGAAAATSAGQDVEEHGRSVTLPAQARASRGDPTPRTMQRPTQWDGRG